MKTLGISLLLLFLVPAAAEAAPVRINYQGTVWETHHWVWWWEPGANFSSHEVHTGLSDPITGWFDIDLETNTVTSSVGELPGDTSTLDYYTLSNEGFIVADIQSAGDIDSEGRLNLHHYLNSILGVGSMSSLLQQWVGPRLNGDQWLYHFYVDNVWVGVPEPGTLALLTLGLGGIGFARRRKQS